MYCKNCGQKIADNSKFCSYCGSRQDELEKSEKIENGKGKILNTKEEILGNNQGEKCSKNAAAKGKKKIITLIAVICIIAIVAILCIVSYNNKQNDFSIGVTDSDYTYFYDDSDGAEVISILIPKYDFEDFSIEITYYAESGLLNYFEEEHYLGDVKAGTQLKFTKAVSDIEKEINGKYAYADIRVMSGKKQLKNHTPDQGTEYNTECDFSFTLHHPAKMNLSIDVTITNKTNYYISELRKFRVSVTFEDGANTQFYTPRIKLEEKLAPNETVTITGLTGNFTSQGIEVTNTAYYSTGYSAAQYQVIYG